MYDLEKLKWVNGQHIKKMDNAHLITLIAALPESTFFNKQTPEWKNAAVELLKNGHAHFVSDFPRLINDMILKENLEMTDALKDILSWETTPKIIEYISSQVNAMTTEFMTEVQMNGWMEHVKKEMGVKGKPLFMGVRATLTGQDHGPDLKFLIPLTPLSVIKKRVSQLKA